MIHIITKIDNELRDPADPAEQWFSKCSPWSISKKITWELFRNTNSLHQKPGNGAQQSI